MGSNQTLTVVGGDRDRARTDVKTEDVIIKPLSLMSEPREPAVCQRLRPAFGPPIVVSELVVDRFSGSFSEPSFELK